MLQSRSAFRALAKNRTNSPSPSSRQGRLFPPFSRISVFHLLGSNLLLRPIELGPVDPHAMQNDCELARDRDLGLAEPVALCIAKMVKGENSTVLIVDMDDGYWIVKRIQKDDSISTLFEIISSVLISCLHEHNGTFYIDDYAQLCNKKKIDDNINIHRIKSAECVTYYKGHIYYYYNEKRVLFKDNIPVNNICIRLIYNEVKSI